MAVTAVVEHRTGYRFDPPTRLRPHTLLLRPAESTPGLRAWSLDVAPPGARATWRAEGGWWRGRLVVPGPTAALALTATTTIDHAPLDPTRPDPARPEPGRSPAPTAARPAEAVGRLVTGLAAPAATAEPATALSALVEVAARVAAAVAHEERHDPGARPAAAVLATGRGSCRDAAAVLAEALRALGVPARVVTGLLVQLAGQVDLVGPWAHRPAPAADASSLHAWAEAWVPMLGWVGLDPTDGRPTGAGHLPLATHPRQAPVPVVGTTGPCRATLEVVHEVRRIPGTRPADAAPAGGGR